MRKSSNSEESIYHLTPIKTQTPEEATNMYQNGYWSPSDIAKFSGGSNLNETPLRMNKTQASSQSISPKKMYIAHKNGNGFNDKY